MMLNERFCIFGVFRDMRTVKVIVAAPVALTWLGRQ